MSNTSVACPGEAVLFTCSGPSVSVRWQVAPPAESGLMSVQSKIFLASSSMPDDSETFGSGVITFEVVFVSEDGGALTSTLINLSEVSVLDGSNVTCTITNNQDLIRFQQRISVASLF